MRIQNLVMLLFAIFFYACNQTDKAMGKKDTVKIENHTGHEGGDKGNTAGLALKNGSKWQTDESTRTHAAALNAKAEELNKIENADVAAYKTFSAEIQKELSGLVSDCKMKGADHDALHLWLEPVMKDVNDLKKVTTTGDGKHTAEKLTEDIQKFKQYFN